MLTYAAPTLLAEAAYVAQQYSWGLDAVLDLEHRDRHFFMDRVSSANNDTGAIQ